MKHALRTRRGRALLLVGLLGLASLLIVSSFGASAEGKALQPRNDPSDKRNRGTPQSLGAIHGSNRANDCWAHHEGEGMRDVVIVYPLLPEQFKVNERAEFSVFILNTWKHELRDLQLSLSLMGEEQILAVEGTQAGSGSIPPDVHYRWSSPQFVLGPPQSTSPQIEMLRPPDRPSNFSLFFHIPPGAAGLIAQAEFKPRLPPPETIVTPEDGYTTRLRYVGAHAPRTGGFPFHHGDWDNRTKLTKTYFQEAPAQGLASVEIVHDQGDSRETDIYVNVTIVMGGVGGGSAQKTYDIKIEESLRRIAPVNQGGKPVEVPVKVAPFRAGVQKMEFSVKATAYYKHQDPTTPNEDIYTRWAVLDEEEDHVTSSSIIAKRHAVVGQAFVASSFAVAAPTVEIQWQFVLAEASGFAAAGLLLPSLLLGGTYGKASRRMFNTLLGGAKRRVMYHNLVSLGLSFVAVVHIILFLHEIRYTVAMGVLWGGLGALSLLVLGLTGYYQVPLIQRHGYKWWRNTHLVFGLLVVVFVVYHMIADGAHFFFIKERLPEWLNKLNLAQR